MTKTEQLIYKRILEANDRDEAANEYRVIDQTKGTRLSWRRGYGRVEGQKPKANQVKALEALIASGKVVKRWTGLYIAGHKALQCVAASMNLLSEARRIDEKRRELEALEQQFAEHQQFVREQANTP